MAKSLKTLLQGIIPQQASWKAKLLNEWPTVIGHLHEHVSLQKIYADALVLGVKDSSWLQELYLLSGVLIETINKSLDKPRIIRLYFKNVGDMEHKQLPTAQPLRQPKILDPIPRKQHLTRHQEATLAKVKDPELKDALKNLLFICYKKEKL